MTTVPAQDTTIDNTAAPCVGPEFHPLINHQTNRAVTSREVRLTERGLPWPVLFSSDTKEALIGSSTNRTCLLNGRMFRVDLGDQGFLITPSRPLGADQLTEQKAVEFAEQAFHGEPGSKYIDLRGLLKQERELHLANPLSLQELTIKPEGTNLVVSFVSFTRLGGMVVLDQRLNVLSMALADSKK